MTTAIVIAVTIFTAGFAVALGGYGPARGQADALKQALDSIARQPDEADRITRTLFVGMAMVESTAIYALVIALILLFANPLLELVR
ncbi:MAG: ATP synthase F0 subunit C [Sandaracinaceae bacterium]|nr:ATP synthase F0 subunit C [Sandaracinaceae bacterium]MCC6874102.1 ATP synthase F0 subunit C [Sandaracinaceae bacterium]